MLKRLFAFLARDGLGNDRLSLHRPPVSTANVNLRAGAQQLSRWLLSCRRVPAS